MKIEFPSFRYHATLPPVIVNDPEEESKLGDGWADTPAAFDVPEVPEPKKKKGK